MLHMVHDSTNLTECITYEYDRPFLKLGMRGGSTDLELECVLKTVEISEGLAIC